MAMDDSTTLLELLGDDIDDGDDMPLSSLLKVTMYGKHISTIVTHLGFRDLCLREQ